MKYLIKYESYNEYIPNIWRNTSFKNISLKDDKIYVKPFSLANEMINSIIKNDKYTKRAQILHKEKEYRDLLNDILLNKVITFMNDNGNYITDIFTEIRFLGGHQGIPDNSFQFDIIEISVEHEEDGFVLDDDEIIIHLNIDPKTFRGSKKFNL